MLRPQPMMQAGHTPDVLALDSLLCFVQSRCWTDFPSYEHTTHRSYHDYLTGCPPFPFSNNSLTLLSMRSVQVVVGRSQARGSEELVGSCLSENHSESMTARQRVNKAKHRPRKHNRHSWRRGLINTRPRIVVLKAAPLCRWCVRLHTTCPQAHQKHQPRIKVNEVVLIMRVEIIGS